MPIPGSSSAAESKRARGCCSDTVPNVKTIMRVFFKLSQVAGDKVNSLLMGEQKKKLSNTSVWPLAGWQRCKVKWSLTYCSVCLNLFDYLSEITEQPGYDHITSCVKFCSKRKINAASRVDRDPLILFSALTLFLGMNRTFVCQECRAAGCSCRTGCTRAHLDLLDRQRLWMWTHTNREADCEQRLSFIPRRRAVDTLWNEQSRWWRCRAEQQRADGFPVTTCSCPE